MVLILQQHGFAVLGVWQAVPLRCWDLPTTCIFRTFIPTQKPSEGRAEHSSGLPSSVPLPGSLGWQLLEKDLMSAECGWDGVNSLWDSWHSVMCWICDENASITRRCFSWCWAALTQSQNLFVSVLSCQQGAGRGHSSASWPKGTGGISRAVWGCAQP